MEVLYKDDFNKIKSFTGIGLGNFDGIHIGHFELINKLIAESELQKYKSLIYTFARHTGNVLDMQNATPIITKLQKKINILGQTSLDYMFLDTFDKTFSTIEPEEFVKSILIDKLKMKLAVVGYNYSFGYKGKGNVELLRQMGEIYGFNVIVIPPVKRNNEIVSSTEVRNAITNGNIEKANDFLGRKFSLLGEVVKGKQLGRTLGFPTANVELSKCILTPQEGVYVTQTIYQNKIYKSITNIGRNSTFECLDYPVMETHIFDFDKVIYGEEIEVIFIHKIRGEIKFSSKDELIAQIHNDVSIAKKALNKKLN